MLTRFEESGVREDLEELAESIAALRELQAWVETKLAAAADGFPRR